jgi:hypothetical protein
MVAEFVLGRHPSGLFQSYVNYFRIFEQINPHLEFGDACFVRACASLPAGWAPEI